MNRNFITIDRGAVEELYQKVDRLVQRLNQILKDLRGDKD